MSDMFDADELRDDGDTEEAHYYFTLGEFVDLLKRHGYERVMKDVDKCRFQRYGDSNSDVPLTGPSWD